MLPPIPTYESSGLIIRTPYEHNHRAKEHRRWESKIVLLTQRKMLIQRSQGADYGRSFKCCLLSRKIESLIDSPELIVFNGLRFFLEVAELSVKGFFIKNEIFTKFVVAYCFRINITFSWRETLPLSLDEFSNTGEQFPCFFVSENCCSCTILKFENKHINSLTHEHFSSSNELKNSITDNLQ